MKGALRTGVVAHGKTYWQKTAGSCPYGERDGRSLRLCHRQEHSNRIKFPTIKKNISLKDIVNEAMYLEENEQCKAHGCRVSPALGTAAMHFFYPPAASIKDNLQVYELILPD